MDYRTNTFTYEVLLLLVKSCRQITHLQYNGTFLEVPFSAFVLMTTTPLL